MIAHFQKLNDIQSSVPIPGFDRLNIGSNDTAARWGGEEFVVVSPEVDSDVAEQLAERIRISAGACAVPPSF